MPEQEKAEDPYTLTTWGNPKETIKSGYGPVSYREWCILEKERHAAKGQTVRIIRKHDGQIALSLPEVKRREP